MASLRETQIAFASALRPRGDESGNDTVAVRPVANLDVYRNNADWQFRNSLSLSFPVVRRRVGDDYFRQLAFHYRVRFPSRSGDLHWVGRDFAEFLAAHLAGGDYAWLADLARLEWAREQASIAEVRTAVGAESLASFPADALGELVFELQPSLFLGESEFPVASIWLANQVDNAPPVVQSSSIERYMVLSRDNGVTVTPLSQPHFSFLASLKRGLEMGEAMSIAGLDEAGLLSALQFLFGERLVTGIRRSDVDATRS